MKYDRENVVIYMAKAVPIGRLFQICGFPLGGDFFRNSKKIGFYPLLVVL